MPKHLPIQIDPSALAKFCKRHRIAKLSLFGSVLRDDFGPESDVDVLIEFEPGADRSLFTLVDIQDELAGMFARSIHVCTARGLSKYFRDEVLAEAKEQYVAA